MTPNDTQAEAIALASQMLASSDQLIVRVRRLRQLLQRLDVDLNSSEALNAILAVDSEADAWPIGVGSDQVDPAYARRCNLEMDSYGDQVRQSIHASCRAVLTLLSSPGQS